MCKKHSGSEKPINHPFPHESWTDDKLIWLTDESWDVAEYDPDCHIWMNKYGYDYAEDEVVCWYDMPTREE